MKLFAPILAAVMLGTSALRADAPVEQPAKAQTYKQWVPPEFREIGVDEKSGDVLPLDLKFFNERGEVVSLKDYFDNTKPVLLQLGYFGCPQLCGQITTGMVKSMKQLTLDLGKDYRLIYVSFDPAEKYQLAAQKKESILREYGRPDGAGSLHLLTGDLQQINQLTRAVGYKYKYVETQQQYSHPAVLMLFTPDGRLSRYLYGQEFDPKTLRLSLVEASEGKIGTTVDRIMLTCFMYDGTTGRYGPRIARMIMQIGGAVSVLVLASTLSFLYVREHRRKAAETRSPAQQ